VTLTALLLCAFALPAARTLAGQFNSQGMLGVCYGVLVLVLEMYSLWSYWKGCNWARVLVLITSILIVSGGSSNIFERGGGLIALMSHPVYFLRFAVAVFLLYWLNTRPVRAWFKNAPAAGDLIGQHLEGKLCIAIARSAAAPDPVWTLAFEHDAELILTCPWRIVLDDNLAFASNSSSNPVPELPVDDEQPARLLPNLRVKAVRVTPRTSDLYISFEMGIELQTWCTAPKTQQWKYSDPTLTVIADSAGLNSQSIAAPVPSGDSSPND